MWSGDIVCLHTCVTARAITLVHESLKVHALLKCILITEVYGRFLGKRRRLNRQKLATVHWVVFQVEFSLFIAFLGPLEGSAVEKVRGMSLQYPTTQEVVYLCNEAVSEKSPQIFWPSLPVEYMAEFSGRTDAPEVRCDLTDRHDDYSNPRCTCAPRVNDSATDKQYCNCYYMYNHLVREVKNHWRSRTCWNERERGGLPCLFNSLITTRSRSI